MLVQGSEWDARRNPDTAARCSFNSRDFDLGQKQRLVDGEHVFGAGSVAPGHQSLDFNGSEIVLAADACYFCQTLSERLLPALRLRPRRDAGLARPVGALERGGARIFFGHDPEFWRTAPQAPVPSGDAMAFLAWGARRQWARSTAADQLATAFGPLR
jgi:N-acyl homoserine lactone hydrolase